MFKLFVIIGLGILLSGCATITKKTYFESGQVQSDFKKEGFINWSDGDGKVINMPLANPSVIGK